jgi:hypothetical protein
MDQAIGERTIALIPMILNPGGMDGVGAKMPCADLVMLATDHPPEARDVALSLVWTPSRL